MTYTVKEIFKTVQGEGAFTGRAAVFCRFTGCNLWSGREQDRATAVCKFCDTEFVGGRRYSSATDLADAILSAWGKGKRHRFVVLTGGEPALQYDEGLRQALRARGFYIAIETNGTVSLGAKADWLTVSPKSGSALVLTDADELKVVYPQDGMTPDEAAERIEASYYSVQPMDGPQKQQNTDAAFRFVLDNPHWRIGVQMHKAIGVA